MDYTLDCCRLRADVRDALGEARYGDEVDLSVRWVLGEQVPLPGASVQPEPKLFAAVAAIAVVPGLATAPRTPEAAHAATRCSIFRWGLRP